MKQITWFFEGWKLRKSLHDAIALMDCLPENYVSLEISSYEEYHGRENFGNSSEGSILVEKHIRKNSPILYKVETLFKEAENRRSNSLGVIGEPGVGKTLLSKTLLGMQATNTSFDDKEAPYLFHIKFRDINFEKEISVLEFLVGQMVSGWKFQQEEDDALLKLINESSSVHIFADGLDEGDDKLFSTPLVPASQMGLYDLAAPDVIIKNLLAGRILPKAMKLVTSRPNAFLNLHPDCKPKFNVRILGLSPASQEKLVWLLCNKNDAEYSKVKKKFDENPGLLSFCYNPLQCKITVKILKLMEHTENVSTVTSTMVFVETLLRILKRKEHLLKELLHTVKTLTELAVNAMKDGKFIFQKKDLTDLKHETLNQFFMAKTASFCLSGENILEGDKRFYFVHLLWQELFAAMWLMFFSNKKQFEELLKVLSENRWKAVLKFAFGFQNDEVKNKIITMFESLASKSNASLFFIKCKLLRKFHQNALDKGYLAEPCHYALEANQPSLNEDLATRLPKNLILPLALSQSDACAIAHALSIEPSISRKISMEHSSKADGTILQGNSLKILMDAANSHGHEVMSI